MLCYHIYVHTVVYKLKVILKLLLIYGGMYEKTGYISGLIYLGTGRVFACTDSHIVTGYLNLI